MNSVLQQLYSHNAFHTTLVTLNLDGDGDDSVLTQLRHLFANLRTADSYVTPAEFTNVFRDAEGRKVNVNQQMDADEFFVLLIDQLEERVKKLRLESENLRLGAP